jgi:hypothetical protein
VFDGTYFTKTYYQYVVVFNPDVGFVIEGSWIDSSARVFRPDKLLSGKANFRFASKYKKAATTPTGNAGFI